MIEPLFEENLTSARLLLTEGFSSNGRSSAFWNTSLNALVDYYKLNNIDQPFGFIAKADGEYVGVILCIYDASSNCISLSSWYVKPSFRGLSYPMIRAVLKFYSGTEIRNFSATEEAGKLMKILGFECIAESAMAVMPGLSFGRQWRKMSIEEAQLVATSSKIYINEHFDAFSLNRNDDAWVIVKNVSITKRFAFRRASFLIRRSRSVTDQAISQLASALLISGKVLVSPLAISSRDVAIQKFPLLIKSARNSDSEMIGYWENSELAIFEF